MSQAPGPCSGITRDPESKSHLASVAAMYILLQEAVTLTRVELAAASPCPGILQVTWGDLKYFFFLGKAEHG